MRTLKIGSKATDLRNQLAFVDAKMAYHILPEQKKSIEISFQISRVPVIVGVDLVFVGEEDAAAWIFGQSNGNASQGIIGKPIVMV